jgi:hypothetical protein
MTHIAGFDRSKLLLLPEAIDDYVGLDNSVRFIDGAPATRGVTHGAPVAMKHIKTVACQSASRPRAD